MLPILLLAMLLPAASAEAALSLGSGVAAPANPQAGAHSNFNLSFQINGADHIRNLVTELPPGLVGAPTSAGLCTTAQLNAGSCPTNSTIGSASSQVTVTLAGPLSVPLTASGGVFNMVPQGSDPATLGIRLTALPSNPAITSDPVILIGHASARKSDFGLNTTILDIPQTSGISILGNPAPPSQVHIDSTSLTLNSSFITNPTSCGTKTTRITATSYEGGSETLAPTFDSTGCQNEAYHPNFAMTLDMGKDAAHVGHPDLTTAVTQASGEANSKRVEAILPKTLQPNNAALINQCPLANFQASTCPANTQVGTAIAQTPLLFTPLAGPVYLTRNPTPGQLPQIGLDLKGPLPAQIIGNVTPTAEFRLDNVFGDVAPGLPDVPLSLFKLTFTGGTNGLITATKAVCGGGDNHFDSVFDSFGGQHLTQSGQPNLVGCGFAKRISKHRCKGKALTDVGSKRANVIRGTRKRDVINGLGGNDKIIGLKGNDLLCGGAGKDKISGGPGKDKLFGQAGKDTLVGGAGKDKLAGGKGKDRQVQ